MREEVADEMWWGRDFADMEFFWFSRITDVKPEMWQISIEAIVTQKNKERSFSSSSAEGNGNDSAEEVYKLSFDIGMAIRGKNNDSQRWDIVYSDFPDEFVGPEGGAKADTLSTVEVSC